MEQQKEFTGGGLDTNPIRDFNDSDFAEDGFIGEDDFGDDGFIREDDFAEDDFVGTTEHVLNTSQIELEEASKVDELNVSDDSNLEPAFISDAMSAEEDELVVKLLKQQLVEAGYEINDDMDYDVLTYYKERIKDTLDAENEMLSSLVAAQAEHLQTAKTNIEVGNATYMEAENEDVGTTNMLIGGDATLGVELSSKVNHWVMNAVLVSDDITDQELFDSFVESSGIPKRDIYNKSDAILRHISTLRPLYCDIRTRTAESYRKQRKSRSQLAAALIKTESKNTEALCGANKYAIIRQIFETNNGFETKCPYCTNRFEIKGPAFRFMAYANESGTVKNIFYGHIGCPECNAALLFEPAEYIKMAKLYGLECNKSIDAFISEAKKECVGASVMHASVPISAIRQHVDDLFVTEKVTQLTERHEEAKQQVVLVSDEEMRAATQQFYFKLRGLGKTDGNNTKEVSIIPSGEIELSETKSDDVQSIITSMLKHERENSWTKHDVAVFIMQCISRDYYVEKNKAIFSLIFSLKSNPFFFKNLSMRGIWQLENIILFLNLFKNVSNPRALTEEEIVEIRSSLSVLKTELPESVEELLQFAKDSITRIEEVLTERKERRSKVLQELKKYSDALSYTKIFKVSSCKNTDLAQFLADRESIEFFNGIADEMIIKSYAGEFFDYWTALGIVRESKLNDMFVKRSNVTSVKHSLESLCEKRIFSSDALKYMAPIYSRNVVYDEALRKMHLSYVSADFYEFCNNVCMLPLDNMGSTQIGKELLRMLQVFMCKAEEIRKKTKAQVYLGRDFSEEEIASCERCNEIVFGRFIPKRKQDENIEEYCERFAMKSSEGFAGDEVYDNFELFDTLADFGVVLSVCSLMYDAEFASFGKSIFMIAILCDACYTPGAEDTVEHILGASKMQQNIIKTVKMDIIGYDNPSADYKVSHGIYFSSIQNDMDALMKRYDNCDAKTVMSGEEIRNIFNLREHLINIYGRVDFKLDEDGEEIQDTMEVVDELSCYSGLTPDEIMHLVEV